MKTAILSTLTLSLIFGTVQLILPNRANAGRANEDVNIPSLCINGLLYSVISPDGTPFGKRTRVDSKTAGDLCSVVTTAPQAEHVRVCVMKILYKFVGPDGGVVSVERTTDASVSDAADLCSNVK